jgi:hypothetical protein
MATPMVLIIETQGDQVRRQLADHAAQLPSPTVGRVALPGRHAVEAWAGRGARTTLSEFEVAPYPIGSLLAQILALAGQRDAALAVLDGAARGFRQLRRAEGLAQVAELRAALRRSEEQNG